MNFKILACLAATTVLVACAATSADSESSSAAESAVSSDGGTATDAATDASATDAGPAMPTYAEEAPVIAQNCGGCHGTKFNTLAKVVQNKAKMVQELQQQKMPKDNPTWSTTADGQALLDFLENSPELN